MHKLKYILGSGAASAAMALGVALPAAAAPQSTVCVGGVIATNVCPNVNVNNSRTRTTTLGNNSAIIRNNVLQVQSTNATTGQANIGVATGTGVGGAGVGTGTGILGAGTGVGVGGAGTGAAANLQGNNSTNTATGTQNGGVNFQ